MDRSTSSIEIFCCYARKDRKWLLKLKDHLALLKHEGLITFWDDTKIHPGDEWEKVIHHSLKTAKIILLLVSPHFISSDYAYGIEMKHAMRRHERGDARVVPIILRPVDWQKAPFGKLQALPTNGKPVLSWPRPDEAFLNVTDGLRSALESVIHCSSLASLDVSQAREQHRLYLEVAMEEAYAAYLNGMCPVGTVIVGPEGEIISRAHNHVHNTGKEDFTAHAEVEAIRRAGGLLSQKDYFARCTLYTTTEPCLMCCGAILQAHIKHVIWVMDDELQGGLRHLSNTSHFFGEIYEHSLADLTFSSCNEDDLIERMGAWMENWLQRERETMLKPSELGLNGQRSP